MPGKRGFDAMEAFIAGGGEIQVGETARVFGRGPDGKPAEVQPGEAKRHYRRRVYGLTPGGPGG